MSGHWDKVVREASTKIRIHSTTAVNYWFWGFLWQIKWKLKKIPSGATKIGSKYKAMSLLTTKHRLALRIQRDLLEQPQTEDSNGPQEGKIKGSSKG